MKHYTEFFQAYLSDELDAGTRAEVARHLAECAGCAGRLAEQQALWEALAEVAAAHDGTSVWPAVQARTTAGSRGWFYGAGRWTQSSLAAGALAAGLLLGVLLPGGGGSGSGVAMAEELDEAETLWISGTTLEAGESDFEALWFPSATDSTEQVGEGAE